MSELVANGLGEIEATHETLRKMVHDLENLDATIMLLRQASEPLTSRDIAWQLLVRAGAGKSDQQRLRLMKAGWRGLENTEGKRRG